MMFEMRRERSWLAEADLFKELLFTLVDFAPDLIILRVDGVVDRLDSFLDFGQLLPKTVDNLLHELDRVQLLTFVVHASLGY